MRNSERDGFVLIGVLVFCILLSPIIAAFAETSRMTARGAYIAGVRQRQLFYIDGLSDVIAAKVALDREFFGRLREGVSCVADDADVHIAVFDHNGKIDLNHARSDLLQAGFQTLGISQEPARLLQEYVEASRSGSELPRELAQSQDFPQAKAAEFMRVEELYDVFEALGLPQMDATGIFTVYRGDGSINARAALPRLQRLLLRPPGIQGVSQSEEDGLEYFDIEMRLSEPIALLKTYRAVQNDVRLVARKRLTKKKTKNDVAAGKAPTCLALLK